MAALFGVTFVLAAIVVFLAYGQDSNRDRIAALEREVEILESNRKVHWDWHDRRGDFRP